MHYYKYFPVGKARTITESKPRGDDSLVFGRVSRIHGRQRVEFEVPNTLDALTDKTILKAEILLRVKHTYSTYQASVSVRPVTVSKVGRGVVKEVLMGVTCWIDVTDSLIETEQVLTGFRVDSLSTSSRDYGILSNTAGVRVFYSD